MFGWSSLSDDLPCYASSFAGPVSSDVYDHALSVLLLELLAETFGFGRYLLAGRLHYPVVTGQESQRHGPQRDAPIILAKHRFQP